MTLINQVNKKNNLAIKNPELCKEWDYKKNYPLTPKDVFPFTHQVVFWKCLSCGNSWKAQIGRRSWGHCKCKKCTARVGKKKLFKGTQEFKDNCLAVANPKLSKEWNYEKNYPLTPHDILCRGKKKYWWKCKKCGYEWKNRMDHRNSGYGKCIRCNSLATKRPDLLKEWDYENNKGIDPYLINYHSIKIVNWKCKKNHRWQSNVDNRTRNNYTPGCPYCSNPPKRVCKENCLATKNPKLAKEWHPTKNGKITPFDITFCCDKEFWWLCKNGHIWKARLSNRSHGNGCPSCTMVVLKDGTKWNSIPEAYMYLQYKRQRSKIISHGLYGKEMGNCRYDFYFPDQNKYVEITSFPKTVKNVTSYLNKILKKYHKNIKRKKNYVEKVLKAKFEFIRFSPTKKQIEFVRQNSK